MTDWRKLDAALAGAMGAGRPLGVFIHVDRDAADRLAEWGVDPGSLEGGIATATLPPDQIAALSEQGFVRQIRLSSPLHLLDDQ